MGRIVIWEEFFHDDMPPTVAQLSGWLVERLQSLIPSSWGVEISPEKANRSNARSGVFLSLSDPQGITTRIAVEIRQFLQPQDALSIVRAADEMRDNAEPLLIVSSFMSPRTQELLAERDVNYLDALGTCHLRLDSPAIYIERQGLSENPWRQKRVLHSLKGPAAARIIRALCDYRPPYALQEVARRAEVGSGTITKVLALLGREALIVRASKGTYSGDIRGVDWPQLIRRWTQDYVFETSNMTVPFLDPRGLDAFFARLMQYEQTYAITGSFASVLFAPIVQPRLATVYVDDIERASASLSLRRAERGANIVLVRPLDSVVFTRRSIHSGIAYAALSQVAADLLTSPGRGPQEGTALIDWMKEHEDAWRY